MNGVVKILSLVDKKIEEFSSYALVISLLTMLILSVSIIVLRWFNLTFHWVEPLIRHLVFLCAFLGGALATGKRTHIGIDIIGKILESKKKYTALVWVHRIIFLASFITCLYLVKSGLGFVEVEAKYGKDIFLGVHSKFLVSIIPFGFSIIGFRFFYLLISSFTKDYKAILDDLIEGIK